MFGEDHTLRVRPWFSLDLALRCWMIFAQRLETIQICSIHRALIRCIIIQNDSKRWTKFRTSLTVQLSLSFLITLYIRRPTNSLWFCGCTPRSHFTPGKEPVPILQEAGWAPRTGLDGRKISSPRGVDPGPSSP